MNSVAGGSAIDEDGAGGGVHAIGAVVDRGARTDDVVRAAVDPVLAIGDGDDALDDGMAPLNGDAVGSPVAHPAVLDADRSVLRGREDAAEGSGHSVEMEA